ncbi:hypothetical protein FJY68_12280 [candidate division WOR-3 bacterium]|uniref:Uncharacterized protein n=1 Tax=candidate division WOR-3 bacterium TaxID=2052148 RepID=A0A937XJ75_UNCW3|nr:hypothetical protein [candidate division WOR-3 bacterium]
MSKAARESLFTVAYVVVGLIAVAIVGYLSFRRQFFHFPRPMLPFLVVGLTGALMYAIVPTRRAGLAILTIVLLLLAQVAMTPPVRPATLAAAAIFALPVGFALLAGAYVQRLLARLKFGRFVAMGAAVAVGYGLMMLLFLVRSRYDVRMGLIFSQAYVGLRLGAAMGLGFELVDLIGPRLKRQFKRPAATPMP